MKAWPGVRASLLAKRELVVAHWQDKVLADRVSMADTDRMWRLTRAIDEAIEGIDVDVILRDFERDHS